MIALTRRDFTPLDQFVRDDGILCAALFSDDRRFRYSLFRDWDGPHPARLNVVALNPSTADERRDDLTVHKCIQWAKMWGFGGLCVTNIFAFRSTNPKALFANLDPVGPENDYWLTAEASEAKSVLVAWGDSGPAWRPQQVRQLLPTWQTVSCFGRTAKGQPKHPCRLAYLTPRVPFPFGHH